jgi:phosphoenolpyruvate synthase/pyruvate phosphate dikinase
MKKKVFLAILACFLLFIGGLIYLCFRPPILLLFKWLDFIGFNYSIFQMINIRLPSFFIYNFSNALFVMFGYIFMYIIWDKDKYHYFMYISIITILSIVYEIITKDISDILTILVTFIIGSLIYTKNHGVNYEK